MQCRCHGGPEEEQGLVVLVELVLNGVVDVVDTVVVAAVVLAAPAVVAVVNHGTRPSQWFWLGDFFAEHCQH